MLHTEKLNFAYGDRPILEDLTVRMMPGHLIAILGINGSENRLLKNLNGLLQPQKVNRSWWMDMIWQPWRACMWH